MAQLDANLLNRIARPVDNYNNMVQGQQAVEMNTFNLENQKKKAESAEASAKLDKIVSTLFTAKDPQDYALRVDYLKKQGIEFDPGEDAWENREALQSQAMSFKDHLAQGKDARDFQFEQKKFGADQDYRGQTLDIQRQGLDIQRQKANEPKSPSGFTLGEGQTRYGPNGEVLAAGPPKTVQPRALTAVDKNAILEADDQVQAGTNVIDMLNRALAINKKAGSGALAGTQAFIARNDPTGLFDDEQGAATTEFNNIVLNQALSSMKSIFGGNPTEGERAVLVQLQGAADKSPVEREAIINRGIELAKRRVAFNKERAEEIRSGSYFGGASTVQPSGQQQGGDGGQQQGGNQFDNVDDIPEGATFVDDDTGQAYRKENGQVVPVE